jgi:diacylglycerol kinase (ATP)
MKLRKISILVNSRAGKGQASSWVERITKDLEDAGCIVSRFESQAIYSEGSIAEIIKEKDAVVIAGGDGTILGFLQALKGVDIPLYMLPCGNQSLAAKLFGMTGESEQLISCLRSTDVVRHYLASINGKPFLHMCSLGFDSKIVDIVHENRRGPVGNIAYVKAGLRMFLGRQEPKVNVRLDGEPWLLSQTGFLFIANSRMYACSTNPIPDADSQSPDVEVAFLEGMNWRDYLSWSIAGAGGRNVSFNWTKKQRAKHISVEVIGDKAYPIQADGDIMARGSAEIKAGIGMVSVLRVPQTRD